MGLKKTCVNIVDTEVCDKAKKARKVKSWIEESIGETLVDCAGGKAGFYYYLTFKDIETHEDSKFFKFLSRSTGSLAIDGPEDCRKPRVVYIPGSYCVHQEGELVEVGKRQLRLSYGFEDLENIRVALRFMREAVNFASKPP